MAEIDDIKTKMREALDLLQQEGVQVDALRVRAFPFHNDIATFIANHEKVFVVEQNRDAQLRTLLMNECGVDPARLVPILHYDGTPITARFISAAILGKVSAPAVTVPLRKVAS